MAEATKIILFGTGQFSETLLHYLDQTPDVDVVGFCVDRDFMPETARFHDRPVAAWEELEQSWSPDEVQLLGPVSFRDCNAFRKARYLDGKARGWRFFTYIHPSASVHTDAIGENCIILESCIVQPYARIGANTILWNMNHVGHHSTVGDHCFLAGMVGISGNVEIGERCFFGGRSTLRDNVRIGSGCIVGMGASVIEDLAEESIILPPQGRVVAGAARKFAKRLL